MLQQRRFVNRFRNYLRHDNPSAKVSDARIHQFINFINDEIIPENPAPQTLQNIITAIDMHRAAHHAVDGRWQQAGSQAHALLRRARTIWRRTAKKPVPRLLGDMPDTRDLVPLLPAPSIDFGNLSHRSSNENLLAFSQRTLLLIRLCTGMRTHDVYSIHRSSILQVNVKRLPPVVRFTFNSKTSAAAGWQRDSNYVEFLPNHPDLCPATHLLKLKSIIDKKVASSHDYLFIVWTKTNYLQPISVQTAANYGKRLLLRWLEAESARLGRPLPPLRSHDLRSIVAQTAIAQGIPTSTLEIRAGWKAPNPAAVSKVLINHYLSRYMPISFAEKLLLE